ncbi:MAG: T9SS type A sorting domain-containing protein [Haliscomenobacter sp.]|nr:T9SS type A sorting domain-containing protein [Haliscomenobacter sp.]
MKAFASLFCLSFLFLLPLSAQDTLSLTLEGGTAIKGKTVCFKLNTKGFSNLTKVQFSLQFFSSELEYQSVQKNPDLPGTLTVQAVGGNVLTVVWESGAGGTLPSGVSMADFCFKAVRAGAPMVFLSDYPLLKAAAKGQQPISILSTPGSAKVIPDESIGLAISDTVMAPGQKACVRLGVNAFADSLLAIQYTLSWDPAILTLDTVQNLALPGLKPDKNFGMVLRSQGKLTFSWISEDLITGLALKPGDTFYELCFTAIKEGVSKVDFTETPTAIELIDIKENLLNLYRQPGTIVVEKDPLMRPGDANKDDVVNHFDVLQLGLGFGGEGPSRINQAIEWKALPAASWALSTPAANVNFKHLDTDGNGRIETGDLAAIEANWGKTKAQSGFQPAEPLVPRAAGAPLFVAPREVQPGEMATFDIMLGEKDQPASGVYGVAFSVLYDKTRIVPGSVTALFSSSWLNDPSTRTLTAHRNFPGEGRIDLAISASNRINRSGFGAIAQLKAAIDAKAAPSGLTFTIANVRLINAQEEAQASAPRASSSTIVLATGINDPAVARRVTLAPNPASGFFTVDAQGLTLRRLVCYDLQGNQVLESASADKLPVDRLSSGIYVLKIWTDEGVVVKKLAVNR